MWKKFLVKFILMEKINRSVTNQASWIIYRKLVLSEIISISGIWVFCSTVSGIAVSMKKNRSIRDSDIIFCTTFGCQEKRVNFYPPAIFLIVFEIFINKFEPILNKSTKPKLKSKYYALKFSLNLFSCLFTSWDLF